MNNEEAVEIVGKLIRRHSQNPAANLADLFIDETLKKAVDRLRATDPMEAAITLEDLKGRPQGKKEDTHRSCLHDDITVVILHFQTDLARQVASKVTLFSADPHQIFKEIDVNGDGQLDAQEVALLATQLGKDMSPDELQEAMAEMDTDGDG